MADRYGCILTQHQKCHRLAYDIASADHNAVLSFDINLRTLQKLDDSRWCTRYESRSSNTQAANALRMESIHILLRRDRIDDLLFIDVLRNRKLH